MLRIVMAVCERCNGTGQYRGLGFMLTDCTLCNGEEEIKAPSLDKINRNSKSYQKAIKDIMAINPDISRKEAIKIFDDTYVKS